MRKFAKTHEWYDDLGGGKIRIGISKHAAHELSDVVFVELPEVGKKLADKQSLCVLESVKAVADAYSPAGTVVEVNDKLKDQAGLVTQDSEGAGWLAVVQLDDPKALDSYLTEADYLKTIEAH
ncbi:MAG TPA: glycine cleavage system protein GcvH [bacterium]|nr:glycine cleavage system protein GcvH [bacterium]